MILGVCDFFLQGGVPLKTAVSDVSVPGMLETAVIKLSTDEQLPNKWEHVTETNP